MEVPGPRIEPMPSSDPGYCSNNARSLTRCAKKRTPILPFLYAYSYMNLIFSAHAILSSWKLLAPLIKEKPLVCVASICMPLSFYVCISLIDQSPVQQQQVLPDSAVRR